MRWSRPLTASLVFWALSSAAYSQQGFPTRSLTLVVPYSAGGVADVAARLIADKLSENLKHRVLIENRPGAGSILAARSVASAEPDGHTMLWVGNNHAIGSALFKSLPYSILKDFAPVSTVSFFDLLIITRSGSPLRTLDDLIKAARANPGKLNVATTPVGSTQNLAAELLKSVAKIDFKIVHFRTTSDQMTAVLRGDVDFSFDYYAASEGLIADKQVHVIACTGPSRTTHLPDVPTAIQSGLENYEVLSWTGISVPAATPAAVVKALNVAVNEAVPAVEAKGTGRKLGLEMRASTPQALNDRMVADMKKWSAVIEGAGIPKQ